MSPIHRGQGDQQAAPQDTDLIQSLLESDDFAATADGIIVSQDVEPYDRSRDPYVQRAQRNASHDPDHRYIPLDEQWHQNHAVPIQQRHDQAAQGRSEQPKHTASKKALPSDMEQRTKSNGQPKPHPKKQAVVVVHTDAPTIVRPDSAYEDAIEDIADEPSEDPDVRVHTLTSKGMKTALDIVYIGIAIASWLTGARYTIKAAFATADAFSISVDWLHHSVILFQRNIAVAWIIPLLFTFAESSYWPRRPGVLRNFFMGLVPLKNDSRATHGIFLFALGFDVLSTCIGSIMDRLKTDTFSWSLIFKGQPSEIILGLTIGIWCAIGSEQLFFYAIRDMIGLWVPARSRIHTWLKPRGYVRY